MRFKPAHRPSGWPEAQFVSVTSLLVSAQTKRFSWTASDAPSHTNTSRPLYTSASLSCPLPAQLLSSEYTAACSPLLVMLARSPAKAAQCWRALVQSLRTWGERDGGAAARGFGMHGVHQTHCSRGISNPPRRMAGKWP